MKSSSDMNLTLLQVMLDALNDIEYFVGDLNQSQFVADKKTVAACAMMLQTLGENAGKLSPALQSQLGVNISELMGLRNRISHDYGSLDYDLVWEIIENDIPVLKKRIETIIESTK